MLPFPKKNIPFLLFCLSLFLSVGLNAQTNQDPVITSSPTTRLFEGESYEYIISTYDADGDPISIAGASLPSWLSMEQNTEGFVTTFVGNGLESTLDGTGAHSSFDTPESVAIDDAGNLYVGQGVGVIRKISPAGVVTSLAGGGTLYPDFAEGTGVEAAFSRPMGIVIDSEQNLIVHASLRLFKVTQEGVVTLIAGSGDSGNTDGTGTEVLFNHQANDIAIDHADNVYLADGGNNSIRKITPQGVVSTLAGSGSRGYKDGTGTEAVFDFPSGITVDTSGNLYVSDKYNYRIRKITPEGIVTTHAGSSDVGPTDGLGTNAVFGQIDHITTDGLGNLYVSDPQANTIRKISLNTDAKVTTVIGSGQKGDKNGAFFESEFESVDDLVFDKSGDLYIVDKGNHTIRKAYFNTYTLTGNSSGQEGNHTVELVASDGNGGSSMQSFDLSILSSENPIFSSWPLTNIAENEEYQYQVILEEATESLVEVTANKLPEWLNLDKTRGATVSTVVGVGSEVVPPLYRLWQPQGMVFDKNGNLFFVDSNSHIIRKVTPEGAISNLAGRHTGSSQGTYADGTGSSAGFDRPNQIAIDKEGNLFVSDLGNHMIRKVTPEGVVTTFAGSGSTGFADGVGTSASFWYPRGLAFDSKGNLYVADGGTNRIRVITPEGTVSTFAGSDNSGSEDGNGTNASFNSPVGLAMDDTDHLYVSDHNNRLIRKITPEGVVSTYAGSGEYVSEDGSGTEASFRSPRALALDDVGNLFLVDYFTDQIRKITTDGQVSTISGFRSEAPLVNGPVADATFNGPLGLVFDPKGNLLVADAGNNVIRKIEFNHPMLVGNPSFGVADYEVELLATSAGGGTAIQAFTISVIDDTPPVFVSPSDINFISMSEAPVSVVETTDQNPVSYSLGVTKDESLFSIDQKSGLISFLTPPDFQNPIDLDQNNSYLLEIIASDGSNVVMQNMIVSVLETSANTNPVITSIPPTRVWDNENYEYTISTYDQEGDPIFVSGTTLPDWLSVTPNEGGAISVFAGSGSQTYADGKGTNASFGSLDYLAIDQEGNVYVADYGNSRIRKITPDGTVSTLAGSGASDYKDGNATEASIGFPEGIAVGQDGNVYVVSRNQIRKISPEGQVTTLAGKIEAGYVDGTGTEAAFNDPEGIAVDANNNVYVADLLNDRIRKISPVGIVTTLAGSGNRAYADGSGTEASFSLPSDITLSVSGDLYVVDNGRSTIRKVSLQGEVTTLAGQGSWSSGDGTGTEAGFSSIHRIAVAPDGNIYISENNAENLRQITPEGVTTTLDDSTTGIYVGMGDVIERANDIIFDKSGNAYIGQSYPLNVLYKISAPGYVVIGDPAGQSGQQEVILTALDTKGGSIQQRFTIDVDDALVPRFISEPIVSVDEETEYLYLIDTEQTTSGELSLTSSELPQWLSLETYGRGVMSPFAGAGYSGVKDGTGTDAAFDNLNQMVIDAAGNIYASQLSNSNIIRKVSPDGVVTTIAGNSSYDYIDGTGTEASFRSPSGLALDGDGNLYVADSGNNVIRKITPSGVVTTFAGNGTIGFADGEGTLAQFYYPTGLVFDSSGNLYVTDRFSHRIRKITSSGVVSSVAGSGNRGWQDGTGTDARFDQPSTIVIGSQGNLYVGESGSHLIRMVTPQGVVTTVAGSGSSGFADGTGTNASFNNPEGMAIDKNDNLFVSDNFNHRIRKVTKTGVVTTVAGSGSDRFADGTGTQAAFLSPKGIVIGADGNFYIADRAKIRRMLLPFTALTGNPLGHIGDYEITLKATAAAESYAEQSFTISVQDITPPVFLSSAKVEFLMGNTDLAYVAEAEDRNPVTFALGMEEDEMLFNLDATTGALFFQSIPDVNNPSDGNSDNTYNVEVIASDGANQTSQLISINVVSASENIAPEISSKPITQVFESEAYQYHISTIDADLDEVSIAAINTPSWLSLVKQPAGAVSTFAGSGLSVIADGTGTEAAFGSLLAMVTDDEDNIYVIDNSSRRIRKITPDGIVSTLAGGGVSGGVGTGTDVRFQNLGGMAIDDEQNIYIAADYSVKKITPQGVVTYFVGSGTAGNSNGIGSDAAFSSAGRLTFGPNGNLYLTDTFNNIIRKITPEGEVTTFAGSGLGTFVDGNGTEASFFLPSGITIDRTGNFYVVDIINRRIRMITPEAQVTTLAGTGRFESEDGDGQNASFKNISGITINRDQDLYINDGFAIRKITLEGMVSTYAGGDTSGYLDDDRSKALFGFMGGLSFDRSGNLFIADAQNNRIRKIQSEGFVLKGDAAGQVGQHEIKLTAIDGQGGATDQSFIVNVVDDAIPVFTSEPILEAALNEEYRYRVRVASKSGESVNVTATELPTWLKLDYALSAVVQTYVGFGGTVVPVDNSSSYQNLNDPQGSVVDKDGNLYIVSSANHMIIKVTPEGKSENFAGFGTSSSDGDYADGFGTNARFNRPSDITVDSKGNLFVADGLNYRVRKISPEGDVTAFAGNGLRGLIDGTGTSASLGWLASITVDSEDNLYVSEFNATVLRKITPEGVVTTLVASEAQSNIDGLLSEAAFTNIINLATDQEDNLYISDFRSIRKISKGGIVSTLAGGESGFADGQGTEAKFNGINGLDVDVQGNVILSGGSNRIRMITPDGFVTTIAGGGTDQKVDGIGSKAGFSRLKGISISPSGEVFISERNSIIRKLTFPHAVLGGNPGEILEEYDIVLKATSKSGSESTQAFTITTKDLTPPVFTSPNSVSFRERTTGVAYTSITSDISAVNYALGEGDGAFFSIDSSTGEVYFLASPDFESPLDANNDNDYIIEIKATDGVNESYLMLTVSVTDARDVDLEFTSVPVASLEDTELYTYSIELNDPDQSGITIEATTIPDWLTLTSEKYGEVTTYAGSRFGSSNGSVENATFRRAAGLTVDRSGNIFITEEFENEIRKISADGVVSVFAGSGSRGFKDGVGQSAHFNNPRDLTVDSQGNVYVADYENHRIRKISPEGLVSTLAGSGLEGYSDGTGEEASFNFPSGLAIDNLGNLYVTDQINASVRKITAEGIVSTVAGTGTFGFANGAGTDAQFSTLSGIAVDDNGNIYVTDRGNNILRKIDSGGNVSTLAGNRNFPRQLIDGRGTEASFASIQDVVIGPDGNLYLSDLNMIRMVTPSGEVSTLTGTVDSGDVDGTLEEATFFRIQELSFDGFGNLFIADAGNNKIRRISAGGTVLSGIANGNIGEHRVVLKASDEFGTAEQSFTVNVTSTSPELLAILRQYPVASEIHSLNARFRVIFNKDVENVTTDDFRLSVAGTDGEINWVNKVSPRIYEVNLNQLPLGLIDLDLSPDNDIADFAGTTLAALMPRQTEETFLNQNELPIISSTPVTEIREDELYSYFIKLSDSDFDPLIDGDVALPDWLSLTGEKSGYLTHFSGTGSAALENGDRLVASYHQPDDIVIDQEGNFYISDQQNSLIRKISTDGQVTTFAGSGAATLVNGVGTNASFNNPRGLALDLSGNLIVADAGNNAIRRITPQGVVSTIAGSGIQGTEDGLGAAATFFYPSGVLVADDGNIYVSDLGNHKIRKIDDTGLVSTVAGSGESRSEDGTGTEASFASPKALAMDTDGNLYVAETFGHKIKKVSPEGVVTTFVGSGAIGFSDGFGVKATFNQPMGLFFNNEGDLLVTDGDNGLIRKVSPEGLVTTIAGNGSFSYSSPPVGTNALSASFIWPGGITIDSQGDIYFTERFYHRIRKISAGDIKLEGDPAGQVGDHEVTLSYLDTFGATVEQSFTITVIDVTAPVFISETTLQVNENIEGIAYAAAVTDQSSVNFSLGTTGDESLFSVDITEGSVSFINTPDFENPEDRDEDNDYVVEIKATDAEGNMSSQTITITVLDVEEVAPLVVISSTEPSITSADAFKVTFELSEEVIDFTVTDLVIVNGTATNFNGAGTTYSVDISPVVDGAITIDIAAGMITDLAGNTNDDVTQFSIISDRTAPIITIATGESTITNAESFDITLTLSEEVEGFTADDIAVSNGALSDFAGSGTSYTASVTPSADGEVTVDIAADQMTDLAENNNLAASQLSVISDRTAPIVTITSDEPALSNAATFEVSFTLSEEVTAFSTTALAVQNGTLVSLAGSGTNFTATISPDADGTVTITALAVLTDVAGNANEAVTFSLESDQNRPTGILTGPTETLINEAFTVTVEYNEEVSGFVLSDLTITNATASDFTAVVDGEKWTVLITPTADGTVTVGLPEGIASDGAGNTSEAASSLTIAFDGTAPETTAISRQGGNPLLATSAVFEVVFSEGVTGVDVGDFELSTSGTVTATIGSVSATDASNYAVTINQVSGEGSIGLNLKADNSIWDAAGNVLAEGFSGESYTTNFSPTVISLSNSSIEENSGVDAVVGTLAATDADASDTHVFSLVAGEGSDGNTNFTIDNDQLKTLTSFDFESQQVYSVRVKADDGKGGTLERALTIDVTNVGEPAVSLEGTLDFGVTDKNLSSQLTFTINNLGDGALEITNLSFPDGFSGDWTGGTIPLGGSQIVTITFSPIEVKTYSGDITVTSAAGTSSIGVSGEGTLVTSIDDDIIEAKEIKLYPNPARKLITIDLTAYAGKPVTLTIRDITGRIRLVQNEVRGKVTLDVGSYEEGMFILQLSNDKSKVYKKFMIQR